jgi:parallel beta-helix repeat protein
MKKILFILFLLLSFFLSKATTFFVAANGLSGNDGKSQSTPWNFANLSLKALAAGDSVLFKKGDEFKGTWVSTSSGSSTNLIKVGTYGTGDDPVISGFSDVTSWTSVGGGIYKSNAFTPQTDIKLVYLDGKPAGKGRYPNIDGANGGYLIFDSHTSNTITDSQLDTTQIDASWVGAELKVRTINYTIDGGAITAIDMTNKRITWNTSAIFNPTSSDGYGYFVTNSMKTLDQYGEWFYNPSDKRIYMFFGNKNPDLHDVKATTTDKLLQMRHSYYSFTGINFTGANMYIVEATGSNNDISFKTCDFTFSGNLGFAVSSRKNLTIDGCLIRYCQSTGVNVGFNCTNMVIKNSTVQDIGYIAANLFCDPTYQKRYGYGIYAGASVTTGLQLTNCKILNTGYTGVFVDHSFNVIYKNYINRVCSIMDDGGGIYIASFGDVPQQGNVIKKNIVLNSLGATLGKSNQNNNMAVGIYLDDGSTYVKVDSNFVSSCGQYGIFLHNADSNWVRFNRVINCSLSQLGMQDDNIMAVIKIRGDTITDNVWFAMNANQLVYRFASAGGSNNSQVQDFGFINRNRLCSPFNESGIISYWDDFSVPGVSQWTFTQLKANTPFEDNGAQTPIAISKRDNITVVYADDGDRTFHFFGTRTKMTGGTITDSLVLKDHTGEILGK